mmetsp:Transcript_105743/g.326132  ORF Transcript_105743/g.326132 Transcript_105743/m.326132 type:complete len:313 (-) Transcript_105743:307-1245(-)
MSSRVSTPRPFISRIRKAVSAQMQWCWRALVTMSLQASAGPPSDDTPGTDCPDIRANSTSRSASATMRLRYHVKATNSSQDRHPSWSASAWPNARSTSGPRISSSGRTSPRQSRRVSSSTSRASASRGMWPTGPPSTSSAKRRLAQSSLACDFRIDNLCQTPGTAERSPTCALPMGVGGSAGSAACDCDSTVASSSRGDEAAEGSDGWAYSGRCGGVVWDSSSSLLALSASCGGSWGARASKDASSMESSSVQSEAAGVWRRWLSGRTWCAAQGCSGSSSVGPASEGSCSPEDGVSVSESPLSSPSGSSSEL